MEHYELLFKCGRGDPRGFGFLHLFDITSTGSSHYRDFSRLVSGTDLTWEELADMAMTAATENRPLVQNNFKWCYQSRLYRYNKRTGAIVGSADFVVIMDPGFDAILTTYPGLCRR